MVIALIAWLVLSPVSSSGRFEMTPRELSRDEAIAVAEAAISRNGCSDLVPIRDRPPLAGNHDFPFLLKHELICRAMYAREGTINRNSVWIVGFSVGHSYPEMRTDSRDRLILINKDGSNVRLESRRNQIKRILKESLGISRD